MTNSDCTTVYNYSSSNIKDSMLCARDVGKDACQGDGGGPLYDSVNNKLLGVISWGKKGTSTTSKCICICICIYLHEIHLLH